MIRKPSYPQRKVVRIGKGSLWLSLPVGWTQITGVEPGDKLSVSLAPDRISLIITPILESEKQ